MLIVVSQMTDFGDCTCKRKKSVTVLDVYFVDFPGFRSRWKLLFCQRIDPGSFLPTVSPARSSPPECSPGSSNPRCSKPNISSSAHPGSFASARSYRDWHPIQADAQAPILGVSLVSPTPMPQCHLPFTMSCTF